MMDEVQIRSVFGRTALKSFNMGEINHGLQHNYLIEKKLSIPSPAEANRAMYFDVIKAVVAWL